MCHASSPSSSQWTLTQWLWSATVLTTSGGLNRAGGEAEVIHNLCDDVTHAPSYVQGQHPLLHSWWLQSRELGLQHVCPHVVSTSGHHPLVDELIVTMQEEEVNPGQGRRQGFSLHTGSGSEGLGAVEKDLPVESLQGRANHDGIRGRSPCSTGEGREGHVLTQTDLNHTYNVLLWQWGEVKGGRVACDGESLARWFFLRDGGLVELMEPRESVLGEFGDRRTTH